MSGIFHAYLKVTSDDAAKAVRVIGGYLSEATPEEAPIIVINVEAADIDAARRSAGDICAMATMRDVHAAVQSVEPEELDPSRHYSVVFDVAGDPRKAANVIGAEVIADADANPDGQRITIELAAPCQSAAEAAAGELATVLAAAGHSNVIDSICREG